MAEPSLKMQALVVVMQYQDVPVVLKSLELTPMILPLLLLLRARTL